MKPKLQEHRIHVAFRCMFLILFLLLMVFKSKSLHFEKYFFVIVNMIIQNVFVSIVDTSMTKTMEKRNKKQIFECLCSTKSWAPRQQMNEWMDQIRHTLCLAVNQLIKIGQMRKVGNEFLHVYIYIWFKILHACETYSSLTVFLHCWIKFIEPSELFRHSYLHLYGNWSTKNKQFINSKVQLISNIIRLSWKND